MFIRSIYQVRFDLKYVPLPVPKEEIRVNLIAVISVLLLAAIGSFVTIRKYCSISLAFTIPLIAINGIVFAQGYGSTGYVGGWDIIGHIFLSLIVLIGCLFGVMVGVLSNRN